MARHQRDSEGAIEAQPSVRQPASDQSRLTALRALRAANPLGAWLAGGVAAAALAVYVATLAPGLSVEHYGYDGGDLIAAARTLGIPHPTGYPTYTLLAHLFTVLPVGTIAYRANLLSAVCAAGSAGLLCHIAQLVLPSGRYALAISAAAGLTLAFSSLLWSQAVITEVYTLLLFFCTASLWLLVRWRSGGSDRFLWTWGLLLGLGLGNHLTLALMVPPMLILLWPERQRLFRARTLLPAAGLCVAGVAVYAYLPLAAHHFPPVNWGNPQTWRGFLWVITGKQYQPLVFALEPEMIPGRLGTWAGLLGDQFGWWGLALALAGAWAWRRHDRSLAHFALAWVSLIVAYAFFYDAGDSHVYLLPALVPLALAWGLGAGYLLDLVERRRAGWQRLAAVAAIVVLPAGSLALHWQGADLSHDTSGATIIRQTLEAIAPGGLVIVRRDGPTFSLWYAIYAEGQRPDVTVINAPLLAYTWYRDQLRRQYPQVSVPEPTAGSTTIDELLREFVTRNWTRQPVYATDPSDTWKAWFDFVPAGKQGDSPPYRVYLKTRWEPQG